MADRWVVGHLLDRAVGHENSDGLLAVPTAHEEGVVGVVEHDDEVPAVTQRRLAAVQRHEGGELTTLTHGKGGDGDRVPPHRCVADHLVLGRMVPHDRRHPGWVHPLQRETRVIDIDEHDVVTVHPDEGEFAASGHL